MNQAYPAVGSDRLPWLIDEPKPQARTNTGGRELLGWALAGLLAVAGASYWMGTRTVQPPVGTSIPEATVKLPDVPEAAEPEVSVLQGPPAGPATIAERRAAQPVERTRPKPGRRKILSPMEKGGADLSKTVAEQEGASAKSGAEPTKPAVAAGPKPLASRGQLRLWPATESKGASGRVVRIGAFGSRQQAKLGWRRMQRAYPAVARLPATVVTDRNSRGRVFYRFQIGTTSQAHSEVLCQRMEKLLRFSCAVVGLPWKAKVER
jgi:hypothetical protein